MRPVYKDENVVLQLGIEVGKARQENRALDHIELTVDEWSALERQLSRRLDPAGESYRGVAIKREGS